MQTRVDLGISPQALRASDGDVPLIAHVIFRLDVGGLENGLINLINQLPEGRLRHAVICLTDYSEFSARIRRRDVQLFALHKPPGNSLKTLIELWRLFAELRPAIVHTRNLGTLETQLAAALARVPIRIHSEHGWDVGDYDGSNRKYWLLRCLFRPFVHHYIAVSKDLESYLRNRIGISETRIEQIYNGTDLALFRPAPREKQRLICHGGPDASDCLVIGTVGRMSAVKDQTNLAEAFVYLIRLLPEWRARLRLVMIGDGPLRARSMSILEQGGVADLAWLPGERNDVPELMRSFDLFVLPSLAEGISNTILEAMASGLPVVATKVGGNPELVQQGVTGEVVPPAQPEALANAIREYVVDPGRRLAHGRAARSLAEQQFSLAIMVNRYLSLYERMLAQKRHVAAFGQVD
jgi:sugar transferase (PEP-CTERM/EpsH1 system associated)